MKQFSVEYEYRGKVWITVVEAWDRDAAMEQFHRDNPHVELRELRACDEDIPVSDSDHCVSNAAVRGAAGPRTLDGLVGDSE